MAEEILNIPLNDINLRKNARKSYPEQQMSELMQSVKQHGLFTPVNVVKSKDNDGTWDLVAGYRRFHAHKKLGLKTIRAVNTELVEKEQDRLIANAVENMQRDDVPLAEQGDVFNQLMQDGLKPAEIAVRVGVPVSRVRNCLEMYAKLPTKFRSKVIAGRPGKVEKKGKIPASTAQKILTLVDKHSLSEDQKAKLFDFAGDDETTKLHLNVVSRLIDEGMQFSKALEFSDGTRIVSVAVAIRESVIKRIEREKGRKIGDILLDKLAGTKEFEITVPKEKVIVRKKKDAA